MIYDHFDRIEGTCFVTYKHESDALDAIRANDGAVAMDQAITVAFVHPPPPRSLFERINFPQTGNKGTPRSVEPEKKEHNKRHRQRNHNRKNRNGNKTTKEGPGGMKPQEVVGEMEVEMKDCVQEENALVQVKLHDTTMAEDEEYSLIL
jgi:RNA recognition motif-containing protein